MIVCVCECVRPVRACASARACMHACVFVVCVCLFVVCVFVAYMFVNHLLL